MASNWVMVRNQAEAIIGIGAKFAFPILATIAPVVGLPAWVGVLAGSIVPQIMGLVEANSPAPGGGPMKKTQVTNILNGFAAVLEKELTGGAKINMDKLMPTISILIDQTVNAVNALAPAIIADDTPAGPPVVGSGIDAPLSGA